MEDMERAVGQVGLCQESLVNCTNKNKSGERGHKGPLPPPHDTDELSSEKYGWSNI